MTTLAKVFSKALFDTSNRNTDALLKQVLLFLAAASFVALLAMTYGVDLSPGLF
ncbi:hypothetical protein [Bradyrhizobium sp. STM 3809]|uniref:hypothetical protein n=1 Tax=Bradyrhizobium sp. STM 3809 TaxID=551936 RepID=UPI0002409E41|nr:hypothetical protein [Bradyrhizobium sp. STM 3809]CCE02984.1 conserved exported hypothetical protein [Bradyrhizobium sp. STM 3809]